MSSGATRPGGLSRTATALLALGMGLALGILLRGGTGAGVAMLVEAVGVLGHLWVAALRLTVLPLAIGLTFLVIGGKRDDASAGALGLRALAVFAAMLLAAGLLTFAVVSPIVSVYPVGDGTAEAFRAATATAELPAVPARATPGPPRSWLRTLIPTNIFQAAAGGEILPLLIFTVAFALAATRLPPPQRELLQKICQAVTDAMMVLIGWIMRALPLGVFALCLEVAYRVGPRVTGAVSVFIILICAMLLLATILLYPVSAILGRVGLGRFARAVAPAQLVAISTRSSIASLPALVEGAEKHLARSATRFVLPLSVTVFKLDLPISGIVMLLFLARVYGVALTPGSVLAFLATQLILSFSAPGIPSVGALRSLPAYMAAGVPIEGVLMLNAVEAIPDIFKTLVNVTGDMSAATILSRRERATAAAEAPGGERLEPARSRRSTRGLSK